MDFDGLTIRTFHDGLIEGRFSATEATEAFFTNAKARNKDLNVYLHTAEESALADAKAVDDMIAKDGRAPLLAGVPMAVKDNILVKGLRATAASKTLEDYVASYDAGAIKKLKANHAVVLGKTNLDEFAMGSSTENSAFGVTKNPHDTTRVAGGSSGGSAAAVAANMALAGLGSDTGGSIRQPAGFCGVVGLKTTYGSVSRSGLIALASSLDQIGPLTRTVEDAALVFQAIAGRDPMDATSESHDYSDLLELKPERAKGLTVGIPDEYLIDGLDEKVKQRFEEATEKLKSLGAKITHISLPHTKYALSCYYILLPAEASSNLARFDGIRYASPHGAHGKKTLAEKYAAARSRFGAEPKRRIILGTFVLSSGYYDAYYEKAQRVRRLIADDFAAAFKKVDVIATPVTPTPAFKIGEKADDPLAMYLADIFTIPANLAGIPALSMPVRPSSSLATGELPIGFQLIGKKWREADILTLGHAYERS